MTTPYDRPFLMTDLSTGTLWEHRFRSDLKLEELSVERQSMEFLYADSDDCHFMNPETYDQAAIPAALIGRLARDKTVRGEGVGALLLADAVRRVIGVSRSLAVFAIVVDALDETAARFYRDFGFASFPNRPLRLFMPASEAAEAMSRALSR